MAKENLKHENSVFQKSYASLQILASSFSDKWLHTFFYKQ